MNDPHFLIIGGPLHASLIEDRMNEAFEKGYEFLFATQSEWEDEVRRTVYMVKRKEVTKRGKSTPKNNRVS